MSKLLAKLFGGAGGSILEKLSGVADKFIQTKEEKAQFEKEMTEIMIKAEAEMQKNVTDRWQADLQHGNWLTRSVRPLVLIFLIVSTVLLVFIDSGAIGFNVEQKWTDLLQLVLITVIGAYFGGRSFEKLKKK
jgi:cation transport ATPase|tara:strand:- start:4325 stop:4723 length:399 start_codon:yes stop_codon:yes gene_type:complete